MKTTQEIREAEKQQWQLVPFRNVRRCIVGRHGMMPDLIRASDRLVDNRSSFRARIQQMEGIV